MGTAQLIIHSFLVKKKAENNFKMAELASSKLEYLKSRPYESDELRQSFGSESLEGESPQENFLREWKIEDISPKRKRIEIEVFSKNTPQKKIQLVLFLSQGLGF
jgi:hypothetical protein